MSMDDNAAQVVPLTGAIDIAQFLGDRIGSNDDSKPSAATNGGPTAIEDELREANATIKKLRAEIAQLKKSDGNATETEPNGVTIVAQGDSPSRRRVPTGIPSGELAPFLEAIRAVAPELCAGAAIQPAENNPKDTEAEGEGAASTTAPRVAKVLVAPTTTVLSTKIRAGERNFTNVEKFVLLAINKPAVQAAKKPAPVAQTAQSPARTRPNPTLRAAAGTVSGVSSRKSSAGVSVTASRAGTGRTTTPSTRAVANNSMTTNNSSVAARPTTRAATTTSPNVSTVPRRSAGNTITPSSRATTVTPANSRATSAAAGVRRPTPNATTRPAASAVAPSVMKSAMANRGRGVAPASKRSVSPNRSPSPHRSTSPQPSRPTEKDDPSAVTSANVSRRSSVNGAMPAPPPPATKKTLAEELIGTMQVPECEPTPRPGQEEEAAPPPPPPQKTTSPTAPVKRGFTTAQRTSKTPATGARPAATASRPAPKRTTTPSAVSRRPVSAKS